MKTIKKFFLSIISISLLAIILTGCFSSTTTSIDIKKLPSDTFEVNTTNIEKLMVVTVTDAGVTTDVILSFEDGELKCSDSRFDIVLKDFDLSQVGSFTAMLEYGGVVSYFDYQVVSTDSKFAGGDGSVQNPYQITTAEQFLNINSVDTSGKYFKLMNDISFENVIPSVEVRGYTSYIYNFEGTLDGNNRHLYNVTDSLILNVKSATIQNLSIVLTDAVALCWISGDTLLKNVDIYGYCPSNNNVSAYGSYVGGYVSENGNYSAETNLTLIDCDNYVDIVGQGDKVSPYFAFTFGGLRTLTMENCHNYGHIEADKVAFVTANSFDQRIITLNMTNCSNQGKFIQISHAEDNSSIIACTGSSIAPTLGTNQLNATKELVDLIFCPKDQEDNDSYFANLVVDEEDKNYYLTKKTGTTSNLEVAYVVVSLIVPIINSDQSATNRPSANSDKLYFDADGKINLGLSSETYTRVNNEISGEKLFNTEWLYQDGNKLIFNSNAYENGGYTFNTEAPYFVIYAYNSLDELIAGSAKVSLSVQ